MRVLVTGCAGFIGSHLAESLLSAGVAVTGIDCLTTNYGRRQKLGNLERLHDWEQFDLVPLDLADGKLVNVIDGVDVIFHLAAEPGVRQSWGERFDVYLRNNILATQQLLEAATTAGVLRLVYASSSSVYGNAERHPTREDSPKHPVSPYGVTKLSGEHLCLAYHARAELEVVLLRYFSVYGPGQRPDMAFSRFFDAIQGGRPIELYGNGNQTRDFTFVSDVVAATRAAAQATEVGGSVFNIGTGTSASLRDVLAVVNEITGASPLLSTRALPAADVRDTTADISSARAQLGYEPSVKLEDGLRRQWASVSAAIGV